MYNTFFQLIRVALSVQDTLSHTPSPEEWMELYALAKKQSLVGICFAGVQRLPEDCRPPEDLYYKWMGITAKIQHRNDVMDVHTHKVLEYFREKGYPCQVLKGQGIAQLYKDPLKSPLKGEDLIDLSKFRQSGDIDVWVEGSREEILAYINKICPTEEVGELHAQFHVFENTEVEVHFTPSILSNKKANKRLQEWFEEMKEGCFGNENEKAGGNENYNENEGVCGNENEGAGGNENENENENFVLTKMKTRTGICKVERRIEDTKRLHNYLTHNNRKRNSPGVQHQRSDEYSCE